MGFLSILFRPGLVATLLCLSCISCNCTATPEHTLSFISRNVSLQLFDELEELARIVDVAYCVGAAGTGIQKPFECLSRCSDFDDFDLVTTWNTGPLLSDSCGYIALSHRISHPRIIVAFRGTYSLANTLVDLSTIPQEYVPYPGSSGEDTGMTDDRYPSRYQQDQINLAPKPSECRNCSVHFGFYRAWLNTRAVMLQELEFAILAYPTYDLTLVGHSMGGAVAALAGLDFASRGWKPQVTTFGEPRLGNLALTKYIDRVFGLGDVSHGARQGRHTFRRVTHVSDPVPLLPLREWGYRMHGGEIYISKSDLYPNVTDLKHCDGDEDLTCIQGPDSAIVSAADTLSEGLFTTTALRELSIPASNVDANWLENGKGMWDVPPRAKFWQLFFSHRDYFWRLGLCLPGSDPPR